MSSALFSKKLCVGFGTELLHCLDLALGFVAAKLLQVILFICALQVSAQLIDGNAILHILLFMNGQPLLFG